MALLRLFSSSSLSSSLNSHSHPFNVYSSISPNSHRLTLKTLKPISSLSSSSSSSLKASINSAQLNITNETEQVVEDEGSRTRLLAQNVPWECSTDDIRALFQKYGTVLDVEFSMYDKTRNRGLAFVSMGSHEEAFAALTNLEAYEFQGRVLRMSWATPKKVKNTTPVPHKPQPIHNLFVANLPFQARANDLKEFFNSENANVVSAEIIFNDNPRASAGYGFVSFTSKRDAEKALAAFQGKVFMGRTIRVAESRKFLRQETKSQIQPKKSSSESNDGEKSDESSVPEA
jgi:polyadenylate-binding protein